MHAGQILCKVSLLVEPLSIEFKTKVFVCFES